MLSLHDPTECAFTPEMCCGQAVSELRRTGAEGRERTGKLEEVGLSLHRGVFGHCISRALSSACIA